VFLQLPLPTVSFGLLILSLLFILLRAGNRYLDRMSLGIELNLPEIFRPHGYVAVISSYFATNAVRWTTMIAGPGGGISYPEAKVDWSSPGDIGRVCGTLL
jgi:hypothetical protein